MSLVTSRKVGSGSDKSFWHKTWLGSEPFEKKNCRSYLLASNKSCSIADIKNGSAWICHWRRPIRGGIEQSQLNELSGLLH